MGRISHSSREELARTIVSSLLIRKVKGRIPKAVLWSSVVHHDRFNVSSDREWNTIVAPSTGVL